MEAIGTLAGGIAHDFNNILAAILGYTEIIQFSLPKDSPLENDLNQIILAGNRASDLIKQILTFSRKKKQQKEELQINRTVQEAVKMMRSSLPTSIDIQRRYRRAMRPCACRPDQYPSNHFKSLHKRFSCHR